MEVGSDYEDREATWLVLDNKSAAARNAQIVGERAEADDSRIHRIRARCSSGDAIKLTGGSAFKKPKSTIHLAIGSWVMLTVNFLYGKSAVELGLANGSQGIVRGIRYKLDPAEGQVIDCRFLPQTPASIPPILICLAST